MGVYKRINSQRDELRKFNANKRRAARMGVLDTTKLIHLETVSEIEKFELASDAERLTEFNKAVESWVTETENALRASVSLRSSTIGEKLHGKMYTDDKYGFINRIGFSFPRHGIYLHKGAGKGYGGQKGSQWYATHTENGVRILTSQLRHTNPNSFGFMGTGKRPAFPWFDPVVATRVKELADIVTDYFDTMIIDATRIFIER